MNKMKTTPIAINNDYFVCIMQEKYNVLQVFYPENQELQLSATMYTFYFYKNELFVILNKKIKKIKYFDYELRPFIITYIILTAMERNIPRKYIKSYNNNNEETKLSEILAVPYLIEQEKKLSSKLMKFIETQKIETGSMGRNVLRFSKFYKELYA